MKMRVREERSLYIEHLDPHGRIYLMPLAANSCRTLEVGKNQSLFCYFLLNIYRLR